MVIEPGQDMSSYGSGVGTGDGDMPSGNGGSNLPQQQPPDGGILSSQQQGGGSLPSLNTGDPTSHGGHPRFPTTQNAMFMSSRKLNKTNIVFFIIQNKT